ncbi:DNA circularization N-terminal domain-containing protein [Citrobacter portucalensis]|uniref:DNA circularization protein n=1 Tax=Citrobacter portucalensis TaxID=1639133 RepID=UPI00226B523A|nr:DNA circularization N-terminal domain-containing protein [Citrobacter portucalensis]MCX9038760.1 DNA circularization N-terminal domain-containing protein [Citrobacter portucalensis]
MSWEESLQDASFRGVRFDVINTRDSASRDTAVYEYPYVDGGDVDDLGRKPRNFRATALFWGDDYEDRLKKFLGALDERGCAELIHPVFGSMLYMQCIEYQASHDAENVDYCVVEVVFIQAKPNIVLFGASDPLSQADIAFNQVQSVLDGIQTAIDNVLSPLRTVKKWMKRAKSLAASALGMVTSLKGELTGFITSTTDFINYPAAFMNDLHNALSLTSLSSKSSVSSNPGRYAASSSDVTGTAGIVMADWNRGHADLQSVAALPEKIATGQTSSGQSASTVVIPAGTSASDVIELTTAVKVQVALQLVLDATDILSDPDISSVLSPDDIEQIAGDTRQSLQVAITQIRETFADDTQAVSSTPTASGVTWLPVVNGLKALAVTVQEQATAVITQRPPLTTRTVTSDANLHLLAHQWYADYHRAPELLRLNPGIRNPNAIKAGDVLNAYTR